MFNNYRIPRENLLSRIGDVTSTGEFVSEIKDPRKRLGGSFGVLSNGRVNICGMSNTYLIKAITIAIRYSASRKQFGPEDDGEELPVLEYQTQVHYYTSIHCSLNYKIYCLVIILFSILLQIGIYKYYFFFLF